MEKIISSTTSLQEQKTERNYGIDLLRIVSMFMVLILHMLMQGGILFNVERFSLTGEVVWFLENACYCAVDIYIIISGYVGYKTKPKAQRLLSLWLEVFLYSGVFGLISFFYRRFALGVTMSATTLLKFFFPFVFNKYWYFSAYVILFLFMPILNLAIEKLSKPVLRNSVLLILLAYCIIPNATFNAGGGYSVIWMIILYLFGGYLAKYRPFEQLKPSHCFLFYFASICINYSSCWIAKWIGVDINILISYQSIFIVLSAMFLVLGFSKLNLKTTTNKIISFLSPMTFGVYIIHLSHFFWMDILGGRLEPVLQYNIGIIILVVFACALATYILCSIIDFGRIQLFKLLRINKFCTWISKIPAKIAICLLNKFTKRNSNDNNTIETNTSDSTLDKN